MLPLPRALATLSPIVPICWAGTCWAYGGPAFAPFSTRHDDRTRRRSSVLSLGGTLTADRRERGAEISE